MENDDRNEDFVADEIHRLGLDIAGNVYHNFKQIIKDKATNSIMGLFLGNADEQLNANSTLPDQMDQIEFSGPYVDSQFQSVFQKNPNANQINTGFVENLNWTYGGRNGRATPFTLNPSVDCFQDSQIITSLLPREFFSFFFRVLSVETGGRFSHSIAVLINSNQQKDSGWYFNFHSGKDQIANSRGYLLGTFMDECLDVENYLPDEINNLLVIYDGKYIKAFLNSEPLDPILMFYGGEAPVFIRCVGMTASFFG